MKDDKQYNLSLTFWMLAAVFLLQATSGCSSLRSQRVWHETKYAAPDPVGLSNWSLAAAEELYAAANEHESCGRAACVAAYYQTATYVWPVLHRELLTGGKTTPRTTELYHSSVAKLIVTSQRFGFWNPVRGLVVPSPTGTAVVRTSFQGFVWGPQEFQYLEPVGDYDSPSLSRAFRTDGLGVPLVVVRKTVTPQPFTRTVQPFAATAVLRHDPLNSCFELAFYDPLHESIADVCGRAVPLVRDLTAPFAWGARDDDRTWLTNFLQPGASGTRDGLFMIEPYQPGKIPVLFVHGLLSDPATWIDLANELRARPELNSSYQWWAFEYATGEPFLTSAAVLRRQLAEIRAVYDPTRSDPALSRMVVIGHSMGGLVAKLQVTHSGDLLWQAVARRPLAGVRTDEGTRRLMRDAFYFGPSAEIERVVFVGTPHRGSTWARRPLGQIGAALVEPSAETLLRHGQIVEDNPGLFREEMLARFPTSIDLLEPESPLLAATTVLPYAPGVALHSIVGSADTNWRGEPTDGVVSVASARLCGVASETIVEARHQELPRSPMAVATIQAILRSHLQEHSALLFSPLAGSAPAKDH